MTDSELYHESPRKIFSDSPSRIPRDRDLSTDNLDGFTPLQRDFLRAHVQKLEATWLSEERLQADARLGYDPKSRTDLLSELNRAERVVAYSNAQTQMLHALEAALVYEPETPETQTSIDWVHGELKNIKLTTRQLQVEVKRLTQLACNNVTVPHGLNTGMNVLISDFTRSAAALDASIDKGMDKLTSLQAPFFRAWNLFWKYREDYFQVARHTYSGTPAQQLELICTSLAAIVGQIEAILEIGGEIPELRKHSRPFFERRLDEFRLLFERAKARREPMTLDEFIAFNA